MSGFFGLSSYGGLSGSSRSYLSSRYSGRNRLSSTRRRSYEDALNSYYNRYSELTKRSRTSTSWRNNLSSIPGTASAARSSKTYDAKVRSEGSALTSVKGEAAGLADSAAKLAGTGRGSVFYGDSYDKDEAYRAVSNFVNDYNDTVSALKKVSNSALVSSGSSLTEMTGLMSRTLARVGVNVGADGKMSVDEKTFKEADAATIKDLFNGRGSYAAMISSSAARTASQAGVQARLANQNLYGQNGYYNIFT